MFYFTSQLTRCESRGYSDTFHTPRGFSAMGRLCVFFSNIKDNGLLVGARHCFLNQYHNINEYFSTIDITIWEIYMQVGF